MMPYVPGIGPARGVGRDSQVAARGDSHLFEFQAFVDNGEFLSLESSYKKLEGIRKKAIFKDYLAAGGRGSPGEIAARQSNTECIGQMSPLANFINPCQTFHTI